MAGKKPQPAKNSKAAPKKTLENQEVIQGEPTVTKAEAKRTSVAKPSGLVQQSVSREPAKVSHSEPIVLAPGEAAQGKGGAVITVAPLVPGEVAQGKGGAVITVAPPAPVEKPNAPVQRGPSGALGGRKLRRERGELKDR